MLPASGLLLALLAVLSVLGGPRRDLFLQVSAKSPGLGLTRAEWSGKDALLRWEPGGEVTMRPTFSSVHAGRYEVATSFDISFALPVSDEEAVQFALLLAPTDVVFVERQAYKQLQAPRFGDIAMVRDVYFSPTLGATRVPGSLPRYPLAQALC